MNVKFVIRLHYVSLAYINISADKPHLPNANCQNEQPGIHLSVICQYI